MGCRLGGKLINHKWCAAILILNIDSAAIKPEPIRIIIGQDRIKYNIILIMVINRMTIRSTMQRGHGSICSINSS